MDYFNSKHSFKHFSIPKATCLKLVWADYILNSASPFSLIFKNTFTRFKADKTLSRETYAIFIIFIINGLVAIKLASKFSIFYLKYFSISNGQDLAIADSLNPKPSINEITLKNV